MIFRLSRRRFGKLAAIAPFLPSVRLSPTPSHGSPTPDDPQRMFTDLTIWLDDRLAAMGVPGAALGVIVGDRTFTHAYGVADATTGESVTSAMPFRLASLTKIFTASAVAQLAHAGHLDIQQPIVATLPDFGVADAETSATVTTAHLLSHSAGWADGLVEDPAHSDLAYYVDRMRELPQVAPLGKHLSYSNSNYLLAGHLLATVAGRDFETVIRSEVLDPLGLASTGFTSETLPFGPLARGHSVGENGPVPSEAGQFPRAANPSFGLVSSVDDLLTFLSAHLDAARQTTSPFAGMVRPLADGGSVGPTIVDRIGMGWMLREVEGHQVAMSQGSDAGYCSGMAHAPDDGFAIAVLTNSDAALMLVNDVLWEGVFRFRGATLPDPEPIALDPSAISAIVGAFALWDGMTFDVRAGNEGLALATSVGGEPLPDLSGPLVMTSAEHGFLAALGGRVWFDFVRGDDKTVDWLRFAGRLAPRTG